MPIKYTDALDEMFGIVNAAFAAASLAAGYSYTPEIRWPGMPKSTAVPMDKAWARVSTQIVKDSQSSLANQDGKRRYHAVGLLYVQLFFPRQDDLEIGRKFAQSIRDAFRSNVSVTGDLWYSDQKVVELPQTDENNPFNVVATFEYDTISDGSLNVVAPVILTPQSHLHLPVEAIDGIRTTFTFLGLPADSGNYQIFLNGVNQQGNITQSGDQVTFDNAVAMNDSLYAYF